MPTSYGASKCRSWEDDRLMAAHKELVQKLWAAGVNGADEKEKSLLVGQLYLIRLEAKRRGLIKKHRIDLTMFRH